MQTFRILRKESDRLQLDSQAYPTIWMAHLVNNEGKPVNFNEVSIGDSVVLEQSCFRLVQTISDLCNFTELLEPQKYYLTSYYRYYRKFPLGIDNFNICFAYKIIEYSYLWKNMSILKKLSQSMMSYPKSIIDYFIQHIQNNNFSQAFSMISQSISHLKYLGKEILEIYGKFETCLENLGISLKILTWPNMTQEYLSNTGTIEFVFLQYQGNYYSLYTNDEVALIRSQADLKILQSFYAAEHNIPAMVNDKKQTLSELNKQNQTMNKMIFDQVKINIENLKIVPGLFQAIEFLKIRGENANELEDALKAKFCWICRRYSKECILLDCKHNYCKPCLQYFIYTDTENKWVLNDEEKKRVKPCVCRIQGCGAEISENIMIKAIDNYLELKAKANSSLVFSCVNCRQEKPVGEVTLSCRHLCDDCAIQFIKLEQNSCPACKNGFNVHDVNKLNDIEKECSNCHKKFNHLKGIISTHCRHFYCMKCFSFSNSNCLIDGQSLKIHPKMILTNDKTCSECKKPYKLLESNDVKRACECSYCDDCLLKNKTDESACFLCKFSFSENFKKYLKNSFLACAICFCAMQKEMFLTIKPCGELICHDCFNGHKNTHFKDKNIEKMIQCPFCKIEIASDQYDLLFDKVQVHEIVAYKMEGTVDMIDCFKCKNRFQVIANTRKQRCPDCGEFTCEVCKEKFHEVEFDCWSKFIEDRLKELESLDEEGGVVQCPGCRTPYIKNQNCDHVECMIRKCRISFCFQCSCIREPTLVHGTHYHRPGCKYFNDFDEQEYDYKCVRCRQLGKACPRPKKLKRPRRVAADEVENIIKVEN